MLPWQQYVKQCYLVVKLQRTISIINSTKLISFHLFNTDIIASVLDSLAIAIAIYFKLILNVHHQQVAAMCINYRQLVDFFFKS